MPPMNGARSVAVLVVGLTAGAHPAHAAPPDASPPIGFRHDGTARFPQATPPLRWSKTENVAWRTPMPERGNGSPVLVGDRLFVTAEPNVLLCLDAASGRVLWQRAVTYVDTLAGDEQAKARADLETVHRVEADLAARLKELEKLKKDARRRGADPAIKEKIRALSEQTNQMNVQLAAWPRLRRPPVEYVIGYASSTPVSDGRSVFVLFGDGILASFDLAGRRRFVRWLGEIPSDMLGYDRGSAASPVIAGGLLIVPYRNLLGLDRDTGREVWKGPVYRHFGTPAVARLRGGDLVATPGGELLRADTGRPVAEQLHALWYIGPVVAGDVLYYLGSNGPDFSPERELPTAAFRLAPTAAAASPIWKGAIPKNRFYSTPLVDGDFIYLMSESGELFVIDAKAGRTRALGRLDAEGTVFASPVLAGNYIFLNYDHTGITLVYSRGESPTLVAKNELEPLAATPTFSGRRMFLRTASSVYCIEQK